ncbi:restriction endonuclease subunit S [Marinomonas sp. PE14-40]|uniref:restriction endonuclease subunit S n=1 Tax=Marinomonas sp. PE14-40 TaxID=3060621 RepID=UPI003F66EF40
MSWPLVKLGSISVERGGSLNPEKFPDERFDLFSIPSYDIGVPEVLLGNEIGSSKKLVEPGDVLLSKIVPHIKRVWIVGKNRGRRQIASGEWIVYRTKKVDAEFLRFFLLSDAFRTRFMSTVKGVGGSLLRATPSQVNEFKLPLPLLETQKQIAAVLEKADQLRKDCQQMEQELNSLAQSVFIDMFGDPVTNPKGWETSSLKKLVSVLSGATPSKSNKKYWTGNYPWVSPKDMKVTEISDSIDHVSDLAFEETNLKQISVNSILIVVRGMILAHTVPVAITRKNLAINQDIKALTVKNGSLSNEFLLWVLKIMHEKLLDIVSTAAHGTKRIDMDDLLSLEIILPCADLQDKFIKVITSLNLLKENNMKESMLYKDNFNSLMQRAFKGELNLTAPV